MPSPMIHLCAARELIESLGIRDEGAYYLGAIAPDAVHMRSGTQAQIYEAKMLSHMGMRSLSRMTEAELRDGIHRVRAWMRAQEAHPHRDYLLGYGVHILTDVYWVLALFTQFKTLWEQGTFGEESRNAVYYRDTDWLEVALYAERPWRPGVWERVLAAEAADVEDILTAKEAHQWRSHVDNWFRTHTKQGDPVFFTMERMEEFFQSFPEWFLADFAS